MDKTIESVYLSIMNKKKWFLDRTFLETFQEPAIFSFKKQHYDFSSLIKILA
jgi:hypothetical protein